MRLPRAKIQWLMVAVIISGILTWGVPALVNETTRRWKNCRDRAAFHAGSAEYYADLTKQLGALSPESAAKMKSWFGLSAEDAASLAKFHAAKNEEYGRAMYRPRGFWSLGD
jgi:hypothetical protein